MARMRILLFVLFALFGVVFCASIRDPLAFIMRVRTNKHLLVGLCLVLWMGACRPAATAQVVVPTHTLSPSPAATYTAVSPSATVISAPTASSTPSLTPT